MNEPFLAYDCMRCRNEICADRESCLRWLTKDERGPRTATVLWDEEPKSKMECGMYLAWITPETVRIAAARFRQKQSDAEKNGNEKSALSFQHKAIFLEECADTLEKNGHPDT